MRWRARAVTFALLLTALQPGGVAARHSSGEPAPNASAAASVGRSMWAAVYQRANPAPSPKADRVVDIRAVGDVMLGRGVANTILRNGPDTVPADIARLLDGDLTLGNLEGPLAEPSGPRLGLPSLVAPPHASAVLKRAGFDALSLANNHVLDAGARGMESTLQALDRLSIQPLGLGLSPKPSPTSLLDASARSPMLPYAALRGPGARAQSSIAALAFVEAGLAHLAGSAELLVLGDDAIDAVRAARRRSEFVVVLVHWGDEYSDRPNARQRDWARRLSAAGADLIVGSHPHVLQVVEVVHSGARYTLVAYSLGNFIFDQAHRPDTAAGAVLKVVLDRHGVAGAWAVPTALVAGRVRTLVPGSRERETALARLRGP